MRRVSLGVVLATVAAVSPLSAQTWQAIGTPNNSNTGAYWNNASDDLNGSAVCNAGAILTNTPALTPTSCNRQTPVYLPLSPAPLSTSNVYLGGTGGATPGAFRFVAGTYNFSFIGRIAGNPATSWGVITDAGVVTNAAALLAGPATISGPFAIWITQSLPLAGAGTVYSSALTTGTGAIGGRSTTLNQQFAVFTGSTGAGSGLLSTDAFGTLINSGTSAKFYVGMEDNVNGGRGFAGGTATDVSDRDYNDILISLQAVPEPATVGLMGFGLLALAGIAKRRKA
jgi:PEP-CTERM motif